ncbi:MAG: hypothetical protein Q8L54_08080 [Devosia sp.]|nr:hypothetical protein [Devosia sp.]
MTLFGRLPHLIALAALLLASMAMAASVQAAKADVELLQSYIGSWKGRGVLAGSAEPETFVCRLSVTKGNQGKVNYAGRCALAGMNLSVSGTIAYIDAASRYEANMSSNTSFSGEAIGRRQDNGVVFNLKERNTDEEGNDMTITARILLQNDKINVEFNVVFNQTGDMIEASVPFSK